MKNLAITLLLCCMAVIQAAADPVVVSGHITNAQINGPQVDWWVYVVGQDSSSFAQAMTDQNGYYSVTIDLPAGTTIVTAITGDACVGITIAQPGYIVNGAATIDFEICSAPSGCMSNIIFTQTGSLEMSFEGFALNAPGGSNAFTYLWDFGDGTTSTEQNPVHTYAAEGFYPVTLTVTSPDCTTSSNAFVWAITWVNGPFKTIVLHGQVTNETTGEGVPFWSVEAVQPPQFGNAYAPTDEFGYYTMEVIVEESATAVTAYSFEVCDSFAQVVVTAPILNDTAVANFVICDFDIVYPDPCGAQITYIQTDSLTFNFEGNYFSTTIDDQAGYLWDFGDGTTSTEANPVHTYATEGLYDVQLTVVGDSSGCTAFASTLIVTFGNDCPIDTFNYGCQALFYTTFLFDTTTNIPQTLTLAFSSLSFGNVDSYIWDFGDGSPVDSTSGPFVIHTYAEEGVYTVTLSTETYDGCESQITMLVSTYDSAPPVWVETDCQAMFIPFPGQDNDFLFANLSTAPLGLDSWFWDFGDSTSSTELSPYHQYQQAGVYSVSLTITGPSCNSTISFDINTEDPLFRFSGEGGTLNQASGVSSTQNPVQRASMRLEIYPNPTSDATTLAIESDKVQDAQIVLSNLTGGVQQTQQQTLQTGRNAVRINLSDLPAGTYLMQVQTDGATQTKKIIKLNK